MGSDFKKLCAIAQVLVFVADVYLGYLFVCSEVVCILLLFGLVLLLLRLLGRSLRIRGCEGRLRRLGCKCDVYQISEKTINTKNEKGKKKQLS